MALKLLLIFVGEKGIDSLQIFGDSMVVINWIRKSQACHNIRLAPLLDEVFTILESYRLLSFRHVYRERNQSADKLSKEGLQLVLGQWKIKEFNAGTVHEFFHRSFIDIVDPEVIHQVAPGWTCR
jgi:ribonuclease HI